ncbi:MAG TPA: alpha/beta fold hydrolase [Usitatibacter sp.]|nr:alpha/beta fold hydrolase [Usitatibacter sp.]
MKHLPLLAAACLAAAACNPAADGPRRAMALTECRLPGIELAAQCGTHEVWENRATRTGRRIGIHVAIVPARARAHEPDPVVVFAGGPGQGAVALASQVMPLFARLNDTRDIVFIDQRGTGDSHPLDCEEDEDEPLESLFEDTLPQALVERCLAHLDADPRQYVTSIAVEDIDEVRAALGYGKLNLWGGSYGTRVELEYLRRHGEHVRTLVLDGVAPATMKLPLSFVKDGEAALGKLVDGCEAEALCRLTYPDLRRTIESLRDRLARRPVRASIQDPRTGERETIEVTENVFLSGLFRPLYDAELASLLPFGVASAANGDFNPLLAQNLELTDDISENLSLGMHLSVICSEDVPLITPADLEKARSAFFGGALVDDFVRACKVWPRGRVPADYYTPVSSDVPALVLSGGIDPATPPRHAESVIATLPNARQFVAPYLGHGVSLHGCAPRLIERFIRAASAEGLDGGCLRRIPRPLFVLPLGSPS